MKSVTRVKLAFMPQSKLSWVSFMLSIGALGLTPVISSGAESQLTPSGAEVLGSADGLIPAWSAPGQQAEGWSYGKVRGDSWKHKGDKPLYTIDETNFEQYADKLSPGYVDMFKKLKGFKMDVYPTRRSCGVPDVVAENTKKNVGFAKLDKDGFALEEAYLPGIPFLTPKNGVEAMVNMKMRYRGVAYENPKNITLISPRKGSSDWIEYQLDQLGFFPWGGKAGTLFSKVGKVEQMVYFTYSKPAALSGQAGIMNTKAGEGIETYYYFAGQHRVRRMPSYSYDTPQIGLDNQYNIDEINVLSGPLDRFDWKLVGKKEMIVQYNSFGMYDFKAKRDDVIKKDFIDASHRRYEIHRVWVVEGAVRQGMRHIAPKRIIYIDEDSWSPLLAVDYDGQGKVAKVREGSVIPVYETGACDSGSMTQYNLVDGRYLYDQASIAAGADVRWTTDTGSNPRLKAEFYTSDNLSNISDR